MALMVSLQTQPVSRVPDVPFLPAGIETPALVVDLDAVERNIERMAAAMSERGIALRPHTKTHKSVRLARMQLERGANGITVGTLGEAEVMAAGGIRDMFVAYPIWAGGSRGSRLRELHAQADLIVGIDSTEGAQALAAAVEGAARPLRVAVEVDSGVARSGIPPTDVPRVALAARDAGLEVVGVFTHGGHAYAAPDKVKAAAEDEVAALTAARDALRAEGFEVAVVSAGSTPTALLSGTGGVTEERPGTYIFGDRQQLALGGAPPDGIGLHVASTVVSTRKGAFVMDAGAKTLCKDQAPYLPGFGLLPAWPDAVIERVYDYHAVVTLPDGVSGPRIGDLVAVVPNHVCPVVNMFDQFLVVRTDGPVETWPVDARGRSG
jgi:D-serine deaminase-like pyridoxal phosphate-dependent protein